MESYFGGIDLLKLVGAQLRSVNLDGKQLNCIIIPVDYNDITVNQNEDGTFRSRLRQNCWTTNENFRQACITRNAQKENYVAPSHEISVSYSEEFEARALKAAEKRLRADQSFMANNPTDEEIKRQAKYDVRDRARLGYMRPIQRRQAEAYTAVAPSVGGVGNYTAPAEGQPVAPDDDLPF